MIIPLHNSEIISIWVRVREQRRLIQGQALRNKQHNHRKITANNVHFHLVMLPLQRIFIVEPHSLKTLQPQFILKLFIK